MLQVREYANTRLLRARATYGLQSMRPSQLPWSAGQHVKSYQLRLTVHTGAWRSAITRLTCNKINTATPEKNAKNIAVESPRTARSMSSPCEVNQVWQLEAGRHLITAGGRCELNLQGSPVPLQQPNCTHTLDWVRRQCSSAMNRLPARHTEACAVAEWQAHLSVAIESALKTYLQSSTNTLRRRGFACCANMSEMHSSTTAAYTFR